MFFKMLPNNYSQMVLCCLRSRLIYENGNLTQAAEGEALHFAQGLPATLSDEKRIFI
jgi:hypothetical protein